MTTPPERSERSERSGDSLSKQRIVDASIEILDADGEGALTFRALAAHLSTGAGAIYWHVANKNELLAASTDDVIARVMAEVPGCADPQATIRAIALGVFDAIDARPWIGAQVSQEPWQPAVLRLMEGFGGQLQALGVPEADLFNDASALLNYVSGLAGQYAAGARLEARETSRTDFLAKVAEQWVRLDPAQYPFLHRIAGQLPEHDDRKQFLAGIDLILAGIAKAPAPDAASPQVA